MTDEYTMTDSKKLNVEECPSVPSELLLEEINGHINGLFTILGWTLENPKSLIEPDGSIIKHASWVLLLDNFDRIGSRRKDYEFVKPAWDYLSRLGHRIKAELEKQPKYEIDGCLMMARYPRLDQLMQHWQGHEAKLQTIMTRCDVKALRVQNPGLTLAEAKVMVGLKPRLYLEEGIGFI